MGKSKILRIVILVICSIVVISNIALAKPSIDRIKDNDSSVTSRNKNCFNWFNNIDCCN